MSKRRPIAPFASSLNAVILIASMILTSCSSNLLLSDIKTQVSEAKSAGSVTIGAQTGSIVAGTGGTASFSVKTTNISSGSNGTITWYMGSDGKTPASSPSGITSATSPVSSNSSVVSMTVSSSVSAGKYYFTVTFGAATSSVATLTIAASTVPVVSVGAQSGYQIEGSGGTATFAVTTANIAAGTSGSLVWYADSAGKSSGTQPSWLTASVSNIASNASTVTLTANSSAVIGSYYFTVSYGGTASAVTTLTVISSTTPAISVGAQSAYVGTAAGGTATFAVTTANVASGSTGTIVWYTDSSATTPTTAPTGVTPTLSTISSSGAATIGVYATSSVTAGSYYYKVTYGAATSSIVTYKISQSTVAIGSQSGSVTSGTSGSVSFSATTSYVPDGTAGSLLWYSDSSGSASASAPSWVSVSALSTSGGSVTITMTISSSCAAGQYYFKINEGSGSTSSSVGTLGIKCLAPTSLATVGSSSAVALSWTAATGATSYTIYRSTILDTKGSNIGTSTSASYSDTTGTNNTSYYYEVSAVNLGGESAVSAQVWGLPHVPPTMASVTGGKFQRDGTSTNISVVPTFSMAVNLVTGDLYKAVTAYYYTAIGSSATDPSNFSSVTNHPVEEVNWYATLVFCNALSIAEGKTPVYTISSSTNPISWGSIPTGTSSTWDAAAASTSANGYRLPTSMEYQFAAMGGLSDKRSGAVTSGVNTTGYLKGYAGSAESNIPAFGSTATCNSSIGSYAWYSGNASSSTHAVGSLAANELGIYDLSGNVWEWCWDWYDGYTTNTVSSGANYYACTGPVTFNNSTSTYVSALSKTIYYYYYDYYNTTYVSAGTLSDFWGTTTNLGYRTLRGGSYYNTSSTGSYLDLTHSICFRMWDSPYATSKYYGFRVVYR